MLGNFIHLMHQGAAVGTPMTNNFSNMFGGSSSSPSTPDTTPMANASVEAAQVGKQLGEDQLAENKRQYDLNMATAKPIIDSQTKLMNQAYDQGNQNYQDLQTKGKPIQDQMASVAMGGDYSAAQQAKQEEAANNAIADSRNGTTASMNQMFRQGERYGYSPAKLAAGASLAAVTNASNTVSAANTARNQTKTMQYGQMGDVFNTYAGAASQAPSFYSAGTQAGNSAVNNQNSTSQNYMGNIASGNGTIMQGQGMQINGLGNVLNSQTSTYGAGLQSAGAQAQGLGSLLGSGMMAYGMYNAKPTAGLKVT